MSLLERFSAPTLPLSADPEPALSPLARAAVLRGTLIVLATVQFVAFTLLGMLLYPGGAKFDLSTRYYSFFGNFFSDLGATVTHAGLDNSAARAFFVLALCGVGAGLLAFAPTWRFVAHRGSGISSRRAGWIAEACGSASALCFAGVGLTPWNLNLPLHNTLVRLAFSLLLVFVAGLTWVQVDNGWSRPYVRANAAYLVLLSAYVYLLFRGPSLEVPSGFAFRWWRRRSSPTLRFSIWGFRGWAAERRHGPERGPTLTLDAIRRFRREIGDAENRKGHLGCECQWSRSPVTRICA